ncbi:FAD-dependent oxidoreductase [Gloeothece verrucosa]|nr:NAD(P)/FAD-dependent oxidoreductase [Gloeothece verrucosa]
MTTKVIIVGAGPAGLLLAHYLLRRGNYQISIYERRSDPTHVSFSNDRTFPIALSERAKKAIRSIPGLEERVLSQGTFITGSLSHQKNGKVRRNTRKKPLLMMDRFGLVNTLLQELIKKNQNQSLKLYFNCQCTQVNLQEKTLEFTREDGEKFTDNYDLLIGADGANSAVRNAFINSENEPFECELSYVKDVYKTLFIHRNNEQGELNLEAGKIHNWGSGESLRIILVPQAKKALNGVIIYEAKNNLLENFSTKEDILKFFADYFPELSKILPEEEAKALLNRPISRVLTVHCNRYHQGNNVLIIGDAAHSVSPSLGQGCNSALEDVEIFNNLLDEMGDNWSQAVPEFTRRRVTDAQALRELSNYVFPRGNKKLFFEFFLRLNIGRFFHKILPNFFPPVFTDQIWESSVSYSEILQSCQGWVTKVKKAYRS